MGLGVPEQLRHGLLLETALLEILPDAVDGAARLGELRAVLGDGGVDAERALGVRGLQAPAEFDAVLVQAVPHRGGLPRAAVLGEVGLEEGRRVLRADAPRLLGGQPEGGLVQQSSHLGRLLRRQRPGQQQEQASPRDVVVPRLKLGRHPADGLAVHPRDDCEIEGGIAREHGAQERSRPEQEPAAAGKPPRPRVLGQAGEEGDRPAADPQLVAGVKTLVGDRDSR